MNTAILTSQIEALNATPARNVDELRTRTATIAKLRQRIADAPDTKPDGHGACACTYYDGFYYARDESGRSVIRKFNTQTRQRIDALEVDDLAACPVFTRR